MEGGVRGDRHAEVAEHHSSARDARRWSASSSRCPSRRAPTGPRAWARSRWFRRPRRWPAPCTRSTGAADAPSHEGLPGRLAAVPKLAAAAARGGRGLEVARRSRAGAPAVSRLSSERAAVALRSRDGTPVRRSVPRVPGMLGHGTGHLAFGRGKASRCDGRCSGRPPAPTGRRLFGVRGRPRQRLRPHAPLLCAGPGDALPAGPAVELLQILQRVWWRLDRALRGVDRRLALGSAGWRRCWPGPPRSSTTTPRRTPSTARWTSSPMRWSSSGCAPSSAYEVTRPGRPREGDCRHRGEPAVRVAAAGRRLDPRPWWGPTPRSRCRRRRLAGCVDARPRRRDRHPHPRGRGRCRPGGTPGAVRTAGGRAAACRRGGVTERGPAGPLRPHRPLARSR